MKEWIKNRNYENETIMLIKYLSNCVYSTKIMILLNFYIISRVLCNLIIYII